MDDRYRAYSFVDRIDSVEPGVRIRGSYAIPGGIASFPIALVAEATGQLAAWSAMKAVDFAVRPVAGIAGRIELHTEVRPGQELVLEAELENADMEAISYGGTARVDGRVVLELGECLGPMVPMEDFDDPAAVAERYALLCGDGAEPGGFGGVPEIAVTPVGGEAGEWTATRFKVPEEAAFFGDHFPRNPVFPGTLMMDLNMRGAVACLLESAPPADGQRWRVNRMTDMKMRSFIPPGTELESRVEIEERDGGRAVVRVETRRGKRRVCGGRSEVVLEEVPS